MSVEAVMGRIDQILKMQQQLADPQVYAAAAASSSATGSAGAAYGSTGAAYGAAGAAASAPAIASGPNSFSAALASAQGSAPMTASDAGLFGAGSAPAQVQAMTNMANSLVGKPYVWGGGHGSWAPQSGYDCSGFVSAVLHAGGYLSAPADTTSMPSQPGMEPGPGQFVTVYDRAQPGDQGHVIIEINGQFYESGGSAGAWGGGGGVEKIGRPSDAYLATFTTVLHPSGL